MVWLAKRPNGLCAHGFELVVGDGDDDGVVGPSGRLLHRGDAVFMLGGSSIGPGVEHVGLHMVVGQFFDDVHHAGVAQVGAVFFEGKAQHQHAGALHMDAALGHGFDELGDHVGAHAVIQAATGQDDLGVVAHGLGLVGEVIRVHANAVAADQTGTKGQEVPLAAGGLQHGFGVNVHLVEDERQLVDEGDVEVALGVLYDFGGFGYFDTRGLVGAGGDDLLVERVHQVGNLGRGAGGDFFDGGDPVFFVAGVDAFGAVAAKEVLVVLEARELLQHGHAVFFGTAGVHGGFVNNDVAWLEHFAHGFTGLDEWREVGALMAVNGRGHGDDEAVAGAQVVQLGAEAQVLGGLQFFGLGLQREVVACPELLDTFYVDVKANDAAFFAKLHGEGQTYVAQADDGQLDVRV